MNVLVNATSARLGGGITVLRNLLPTLTEVDGGRHRYSVVCREDVREELDPCHERVSLLASSAGGRTALSRMAWEQIFLPVRATRANADLLFCPAGVAVLGATTRQVVMFQNMAPFDPDVVARSTGGKRARLGLLRVLGVLSARVADRVVFISDHARAAIIEQTGIPPEKAHRIYLGRDTRFSSGKQSEGNEALRSRGAGGRYILSVSQFYHYKNFVELVIGFARARASLPPDTQLVIAGAEHEPEYAALVRQTVAREGVTRNVRLIGQVRYEELPSLYAGAELFLFPSACESFPNILVEALSSGVPTLASELGPMREIAGDGAAYFNPFDPDEIAAAIMRYWHDRAGAQALARRGVDRAARYTWTSTALELLDVFEAAAA